ncbi:GNAT family N-acetyltransferase [Exilibacterium tricleocarpae]|uniref:GNAT family N-acetyltransferase n=1 Tax=Exilibacterium tricleocarpae TaxID=2591008 RepID=A0A545TAL6_9GAMM|nr:GNAT family N-acetyltransferase [Exilibacterium tricleocarpae]TQV74255.1 GNAT family N-acetyltransferase [Exilibacterium tricleocarpae]
MKTEVTFRPYSPDWKECCLSVFDENCPKFFAPGERLDYEQFLDQEPPGYELCLSDGRVAGAFGLLVSDAGSCRLNWILLSPTAQGMGIGSLLMRRAMESARADGLACISIAASHLSRGFFSKHGAVAIGEIKDGWGPGMHRVDMELKP